MGSARGSERGSEKGGQRISDSEKRCGVRVESETAEFKCKVRGYNETRE